MVVVFDSVADTVLCCAGVAWVAGDAGDPSIARDAGVADVGDTS